ncbi:hypothetical protein D3C76_1302970 [compost metagenome]
MVINLHAVLRGQGSGQLIGERVQQFDLGGGNHCLETLDHLRLDDHLAQLTSQRDLFAVATNSVEAVTGGFLLAVQRGLSHQPLDHRLGVVLVFVATTDTEFNHRHAVLLPAAQRPLVTAENFTQLDLADCLAHH